MNADSLSRDEAANYEIFLYMLLSQERIRHLDIFIVSKASTEPLDNDSSI